MPKETETKACHNCTHYQVGHGGNTICNLYNKYCLAARIHCKMECWEKKAKEKVKVVGDKLIIK